MKDLKKSLDLLVEQGYVNRSKHADYDLYVYNYSQKTQYEKYWNEYTLMCRGLVLNGEGEVVARPFPKFFNKSELEQGDIPSKESFKVTEKMDGSLGIGFMYDGELRVATRGSFVSDQAVFAKKFLDEKIEMSNSFVEGYTYLFEIIYPENRIVCNYHNETKMTLLTIINNDNLKEISHEFMQDTFDDVFDIVELHDVSNLDSVNELERDNSEGVVLCFESGFRMKIKWDEYVRLHRIVTGVSNRIVWDYLRNNKSLDELVDRVPDEFYKWIRSTINELNDDYLCFENTALTFFKDYKEYAEVTRSRKEFALWMMQSDVPKKYHAVLWKKFDERDYDQIIWKAIEPEYEKPFQNKQKETI